MGKYNKFWTILVASVIEGLSIWQGAPLIVTAVVIPALSTLLVYFVPNKEGP